MGGQRHPHGQGGTGQPSQDQRAFAADHHKPCLIWQGHTQTTQNQWRRSLQGVLPRKSVTKCAFEE